MASRSLIDRLSGKHRHAAFAHSVCPGLHQTAVDRRHSQRRIGRINIGSPKSEPLATPVTLNTNVLPTSVLMTASIGRPGESVGQAVIGNFDTVRDNAVNVRKAELHVAKLDPYWHVATTPRSGPQLLSRPFGVNHVEVFFNANISAGTVSLNFLTSSSARRQFPCPDFSSP